MAESERFLVTGAAGCIGAWVVAHLVREGTPVAAFDRSDDRRRLRLCLDDARAAAVPWVTGDIADQAALEAAIARAGATAVIHLAALQIPFCKADPLNGARVNVVGTVAVFEAVRKAGIRRFAYASSVAALGPAGADHPPTLYGVYKRADEGIARVYWQDWNIPSVGLRPHTVYGPGRDQGLTSAPTKAMVAAVAGRPYTIPFAGSIAFQHVSEVAEVFVRAARVEGAGAPVHDLKGAIVKVSEVVDAIRAEVPDARIAIEGAPLPIGADFDDKALRGLVGDWRTVPLAEGVGQSVGAFRDLVKRGLVAPE